MLVHLLIQLFFANVKKRLNRAAYFNKKKPCASTVIRFFFFILAHIFLLIEMSSKKPKTTDTIVKEEEKERGGEEEEEEEEPFPSVIELKDSYVRLNNWKYGNTPVPYWVIYNGIVARFQCLNGGKQTVKVRH